MDLAATSEDLTAAMQAQRFRPELYHRLATVVLRLPPLRARGQDVLELARHFMACAAADHGAVPKALADDACAALLAYGWPGNVRELANVLERVTLLEDGAVITAPMLGLPASGGGRAAEEPTRRSGLSLGDLRRREREELIEALIQAGGNITRAAARLGSRATRCATGWRSMGSACGRARRTSHLARPPRQRWRPRPRLNPPWPCRRSGGRSG